MDDAREHLLAGAGFAGEQTATDRRDAPGNRQQLGALFGGPDALGVAVEGLGRPEGGALLLVAAVAVEAARRGEQLADRGDGAVVLQVGERPGEELPRLVAMLPEAEDVVGRAAGRRRAPRCPSSRRPK